MEKEISRISEVLLEQKFDEVHIAKALGFRVYRKEDVDKFLMGTAYKAQTFEDQFTTVVQQLKNIMEERTAKVMATQAPIEITEENFNEAAQQLQAERNKLNKWETHLREMLVQAEEKAESILNAARMEAQMEKERAKEKAVMIINDAQEKGDAIVKAAQEKMEESEGYRKQVVEANERVQSDIQTYGDQLIEFGQALRKMTTRKSS